MLTKKTKYRGLTIVAYKIEPGDWVYTLIAYPYILKSEYPFIFKTAIEAISDAKFAIDKIISLTK